MISESLKTNSSLTELNLKGDEKIRNDMRRNDMKTKNEQITKYEVKELSHLVNHWRLTPRW